MTAACVAAVVLVAWAAVLACRQLRTRRGPPRRPEDDDGDRRDDGRAGPPGVNPRRPAASAAARPADDARDLVACSVDVAGRGEP